MKKLLIILFSTLLFTSCENAFKSNYQFINKSSHEVEFKLPKKSDETYKLAPNASMDIFWYHNGVAIDVTSIYRVSYCTVDSDIVFTDMDYTTCTLYNPYTEDVYISETNDMAETKGWSCTLSPKEAIEIKIYTDSPVFFAKFSNGCNAEISVKIN